MWPLTTHVRMQVWIWHKCAQTETSQVFATALYKFFPRIVNTFGTMSDQCAVSADAVVLISE